MQPVLGTDLYQRLTHHICISVDNLVKKTTEKHGKKLENLRKSNRSNSRNLKQHSSNTLNQKWLVNLSSTTLTTSQTSILRKGFNFAIAPKFIPKLDLVSGVEAGLRQVRDAAAVHTARSKVSEILKSAKPPPRNVTREEEALNCKI